MGCALSAQRECAWVVRGQFRCSTRVIPEPAQLATNARKTEPPRSQAGPHQTTGLSQNRLRLPGRCPRCKRAVARGCELLQLLATDAQQIVALIVGSVVEQVPLCDQLGLAVADDHDTCPCHLPGWREVENQGLAGGGRVVRFGLYRVYRASRHTHTHTHQPLHVRISKLLTHRGLEKGGLPTEGAVRTVRAVVTWAYGTPSPGVHFVSIGYQPCAVASFAETGIAA